MIKKTNLYDWNSVKITVPINLYYILFRCKNLLKYKYQILNIYNIISNF